MQEFYPIFPSVKTYKVFFTKPKFLNKRKRAEALASTLDPVSIFYVITLIYSALARAAITFSATGLGASSYRSKAKVK